jgi:hypothetical protein
MGTEPAVRKFRELVCIMVEPKGTFEDVMVEVRDAFELQTAVGDQLDKLGSIVGLPRQGFADDRYRDFLNIQVALLLSYERDGADWTGTVNNVLTICRTFVGAGPVITLLNTPPYAFTLTIPGLVTSEVPILMGFL